MWKTQRDDLSPSKDDNHATPIVTMEGRWIRPPRAAESQALRKGALRGGTKALGMQASCGVALSSGQS